MKVFISHARKDASLANQLAERLTRAGFSVWIPEEHISLGDNWAKKIGKAVRFSNGGLRYVKGMGVAVRGLAQVSEDRVKYRGGYRD